MAISDEIQITQDPCSSSSSNASPSGDHRFDKLRGVRWRINLGILPSSPSSNIDDLRRVTADSRRRYAALRRRLLIDPHLPKKGINSPDLTIDNPLSQNPDSTWGRFFRNAELEKTLDQDLSRLYPEHGSYFQSSGCQGMLRRILLLWCLKHPEIGYRQGMHELLAPLLYVLQVDVQYLTEVRSNYEDQFTDLFDELAFQERDSAAYDFDIKKVLDDSMEEDEEGDENGHPSGATKKKKPKRFDELDTETQTAVLLSDAYGAEGELGIVLSDKFMEHDAYSMFDALMYGGTSLGSVSVANFFVYSAPSDSVTGLPPVIEASSALYYLLSLVDASLHSHLVELGVEPQYFALRWLRVLFGREFPLNNLLTVWDEIFSADNTEVERVSDDLGFEFRILSSPRGALVAGMAVSMILYLRSSLLATENATSSLKRLLNFPEDIDLSKVIEKGKSLQSLALEINDLRPKGSRKPMRGHSLSVDSISLGGSSSSPVGRVPESYWEEKWRVLNSAEEEEEARRRKASSQRANRGKKSWSERVKLRLSRTESDPSPAEANRSGNKPPMRRSLLDDLSKQLGEKETDANIDTDIERSSTVSGSPSADCEDSYSDKGKSEDHHVELPLPVPENESEAKSVVNIFKDRNILSGKFQRLWRLGRNLSGEETSENKEAKPVEPEVKPIEPEAKPVEPEAKPVEPEAKPIDHEEEEEKTNSDSTVGHGDGLKNTGRSMLEHIKVIESVLEQSSPENMAENHRLTVEEALRELRRLGNMLLSEM